MPTRQAPSVQHLQVQVSLIIVGLTDGSPFISLYVILETKPTIASVRDTAITSLKVDTNTLERRNLVVSKINIKSAFFGA